MALVKIHTRELSVFGVLTGDQTPSNKLGLFPRLRAFDDENQSTFNTHKSTYDAHDHSSDGVPLGAEKPGGGRYDSFVDGAIESSIVAPGAIDARVVGTGQVNEAAIADDSMTRVKLGPPRRVYLNVGPGNTTWTHNLGFYPVYCIFGAGSSPHAVSYVSSIGETANSITFALVSGAPLITVPFGIVYYGG